VKSDLARALTRIADLGSREFYEGRLAHDLVAGIRSLGGDFAADDLARHCSLWQEPLRVPFYGHDVLTMPPNSVGTVLMLQLLALEAAGAGAMDPATLAFWQLTIRTWRWAKSISAEAIGDPGEAVGRAIDLIARTRVAPYAAPEPPATAPSSGDTSNIVVMDSEGNAVSLVQSVSAPFASGVVVPGTGILLNNRMRGFNTTPGSVNCVAPGRRPAHTLVPALVMRGGEVLATIGTPGAAGQTLTLAQVLARALACGQDMAAAIEAPRWSVAPAGNIIVERTAPDSIVGGLSADEPDLVLEDVRHVRFGSVKAVLREEGTLRAIADYRRVAGACAG
jgi:gamma-glutamyltranspeptidase/glutathione hydrolase